MNFMLVFCFWRVTTTDALSLWEHSEDIAYPRGQSTPNEVSSFKDCFDTPYRKGEECCRGSSLLLEKTILKLPKKHD